MALAQFISEIDEVRDNIFRSIGKKQIVIPVIKEYEHLVLCIGAFFGRKIFIFLIIVDEIKEGRDTQDCGSSACGKIAVLV